MPIPNSLSGLDTQIAELEANPPQMYKSGKSFLHVQEQTDEYLEYKRKLTDLKNHKRVFDILDLKGSKRKWTSNQAKTALKLAIGKKKFNALVKQAGGYPKFWKDHGGFHEDFELLLRALPEFSGGVE